MKNLVIVLYLLLPLMACEDQISPQLLEAPPVLVVDAFINDLDSMQRIRLTLTAPYFEDEIPDGVPDASVTVSSDAGGSFVFEDQGAGWYFWDPQNGPLGEVGDQFTLEIRIGEEEYRATSTMNRVPEIDSVSFRFEKENIFLPDSYFAEFWSRDPVGTGDTYWIKSYKNGVFLNQPNEINIAFDAGFSAGGNVDGLIFIPPIRDAINPFIEDEDGGFLSPFEDGDSVYVEIYSITNETFNFLNEVRIQTDRPGGFAELFSTPLSNPRTNIGYAGSDSNRPVVGFFSVSAVKSTGKRLDISTIPRPD